ncbi:MAG TPA: DUF4340 domain-containing protein [Myxococcales bacterium]|nr:DUF4340 domain-containing protein [Myxococcales bacterium]
MKQTTRSLATTLGVLLLAAAIGGAALWVTRDTEKKAEQKEKSAKLFDGLDKSKVRQVRLTSGGKLIAVLARADGSSPWKIAEPVAAEAETATVDALLNGFADFKQKSELGEADPAQYGLDKPAIVVSVKTEDGKESALEIGETNPFDSSVYVRKSGEKTVRIADGWSKSPFEKQFLDLRDKRVLHLDDAAEVRRVEVLGTSPAYALEKEGASWKLLAPQRDAADAGTADRVANSLKSLRGTAIAAESADGAALKQYGLSPAKVTVQATVGAAGGKDTYRRTLLIGQPAPQKGSVALKTYAKRDDAPTVFEVDQQVLKDLQKDLFELQDKALVKANREDVRKVVFEASGSPKIVVERKKEQPKDGGFADETFTVLEPKQGPAKKWKASSALYSIAGLRAAAFAAKPDATAFNGARTISLLGDGDKVLASLRIGSLTKDGKRRYVSSSEQPRIAEVEKATVDDLPKSLDDLLEPPPSPDAGTNVQASNPK